jgi:hypothetical protein
MDFSSLITLFDDYSAQNAPTCLSRTNTDHPHALPEDQEVLHRLPHLNIEDFDTEFRRARVISKAGTIEYVYWATGTARLLPRLLQGRTSGLVFLARRASAEGRRPRSRRCLPHYRSCSPVLSAC